MIDKIFSVDGITSRVIWEWIMYMIENYTFKFVDLINHLVHGTGSLLFDNDKQKLSRTCKELSDLSL